MLNYIWASLILIGLLVAGLLGRFTGDQGVITAALDMSKTAVMDIALPLAGMMMFWLGLMRLMEKAGLMNVVSRALFPLMRRIFPDVPRDHPAMSAMIMNLAANMLGLGNNATPAGLKAMTHLQELNPHKDTASNAMVTFLALNTAAFTLLPMTVINYLSAAGIKGAYQIIVPTIVVTACTTMAAILAAKTFQRLPAFRAQPGPVENLPATADENAAAATATPVEEAPAATRMGSRARLLFGILLVLFAGGVVLELAAPDIRQSVLDATGLSRVIETAEQRSAAAKAVAKETVADTADITVSPLRRVMNGVSGVAIPLLLVVTLGIALGRKVKVYEEFVEGAKEGFAVATRIMPFLVAMLAALAIFRSSGALLLLEYVLTPLLNLFSFPVELLPMALMRPLSGSGSLGILNELLARNDVLEYLKYTAAIMFGSTETTFYVLAVYFGSVSIRKTRHAIATGLTADVVGFTMSVIVGRLMFA
ncbi:MAG: nucleoside recognition domain-containing protein [Verrucomicrobiota bacterium]